MCLSVSGGELFEKILEGDMLMSEEEVRDHMRQILLGVQHMHKHNIVHLDLKVFNITDLFQYSIPAGEHSTHVRQDPRIEDHRLRLSQKTRPVQKGEATVRHARILRAGSGQLRAGQLRHRHVDRGRDIVHTVSGRADSPITRTRCSVVV